jgi:hypothetical protein
MGGPLVPRADRDAYTAPVFEAQDRALSAGLHYTHRSDLGDPITCRACGHVLLYFQAQACQRAPCAMHHASCTCWTHTQAVTPGGRCENCSTPVPIRCLPTDELASASPRRPEWRGVIEERYQRLSNTQQGECRWGAGPAVVDELVTAEAAFTRAFVPGG